MTLSEPSTPSASDAPSSSSEQTSPAAAPAGDVLRAWLRLANLQFSPRLTSALLTHFQHDPLALFAASDRELEEVSGFLARHLVRLRDTTLDVSDRQWTWFERHGVQLVTRAQPEYPDLLREIPDPPPFFFYRGTLTKADEMSVGIVGSRHATPYGRAVSERMARELAGQGVTIVSGGAVGIDTAAHRGALEGGGRTLAVLGCGLDVDYPRDNRLLFEKVIGSGAVISEYPLGAQPEAWRFPMRNRLISGLSLGSLVVEAPRQSGALITARYAAEQGRTVMVVPGNIDRPTSQGSNDLLKDGGIPITETEDILRALGLVAVPARPAVQYALPLDDASAAPTPSARTTASPQTASAPNADVLLRSLTETQRMLFSCLSQTPRHLDALAQAANLTVIQAGVEMTLLELTGLIRRLPGNTYIRAL